MNIYVAGSFAGRERIRTEAKALLEYNHNVLSNWYNPEYFVEKAWDKDMGGEVGAAMTMIDTMQIQQSDIVILDTIDPSSTGGSDTETGIVLGLQLSGRHIDLYHIGPVRNIFQTLIRTKRCETWKEFHDEYNWLIG